MSVYSPTRNRSTRSHLLCWQGLGVIRVVIRVGCCLITRRQIGKARNPRLSSFAVVNLNEKVGLVGATEISFFNHIACEQSTQHLRWIHDLNVVK